MFPCSTSAVLLLLVLPQFTITAERPTQTQRQQQQQPQQSLFSNSDKVVNNIVVRGRDQVMLKVVVGEVRRDIVKQLGVDLSASLNAGTAAGVMS